MRKPILVTLVLAAACGKPADEDTGGDDRGTGGDDSGSHGDPDAFECVDTVTRLSLGNVSPLGFSGDDVLAAISGPVSAPAAWTERSGAPSITLSVSSPGRPKFHDLEPAAHTGDTGARSEGHPDAPCSDYLELPVTVSFSSDDGAFAEALSTTMWVADLADLHVDASMDPAALAGNFTFTEIDPTEWNSVSLELSNSWSAGAIQGQVIMDASRQTEGDNGEITGSVWEAPVLVWPPG